jgi:hypothetical protein
MVVGYQNYGLLGCDAMLFLYFKTRNTCIYLNIIITCCLLSCLSFKVTGTKKLGNVVTDALVASVAWFLIAFLGQ